MPFRCTQAQSPLTAGCACVLIESTAEENILGGVLSPPLVSSLPLPKDAMPPASPCPWQQLDSFRRANAQLFLCNKLALFKQLGVRKRVVSKRVVLVDVPWYQKPERGHIRQTRPFTKPPFCVLSKQFQATLVNLPGPFSGGVR